MQNLANDWNKTVRTGVAAPGGKSVLHAPKLPKRAALAGLVLLPLLSGVALGASNPLAD